MTARLLTILLVVAVLFFIDWYFFQGFKTTLKNYSANAQKISSYVYWGISLSLITFIFIVFVTGLLGCLLLFMWFGTDHKSCAANYNLLWALPTNIIACFLVNKKTNYAKNYFLIGLVISGLTVVFWFLLPQQFNVALFPFVFSNMFCYKALWQNIKTKMQVQQL
jgi:hypothetical protein